MLSVEVALQAAIIAALTNPAETELKALIGDRVFDRVPPLQVPQYPYVTVGEMNIADDANTCSNASLNVVMVHVWSNKVGQIEAKKIGGLIRRILAPPDVGDLIVVQDHVANDSVCDVSVYRPGDDPLLTEGVLQFTFSTDPMEN